MKKILTLALCITSVSTFAQKFNNKEYTASNSITYHLGDTVKIGIGSGTNGQYLNIMKGGFWALMAYNQNKGREQFNLGNGYQGGNFVIKKIDQSKFAGATKVYFKTDAPHITAYVFIEDAINACEVLPCKSNNSKMSSADELAKYKKLLDDGAITPEEYAAKKKQILGF